MDAGGRSLVVIADPASAVTEVTFPAEGEYVLRLTGDDGALSGHDDLAVIVTPPNGLSTQVQPRPSTRA